ncbi:hypothetical protein FRC07_004029 [Ceratobasidium sp. 392]|nr:hypothetical protein FRC07_004029 [Ceratobasidium sp. 392]
MNDDDGDYLPTLADFFFHHCGDKSSYSSSLEGLFVCYTLTRGLQLEGTNPRRPALPLELILRITRFAGYMDANPDPSLTLNIDRPNDATPMSPHFAFCSPPLSHRHITSMGRIHVTPMDPNNPFRMNHFYSRNTFGVFNKCVLVACRGATIILPSDIWYMSMPPLTPIPNHFTPDYMRCWLELQKDAAVKIGFKVPAQALFWRWWEPKF